jgi:hypothetical protein
LLDKPADQDMTEIQSRYESLWVAMLVTKRDEAGQPLRGRVLCQHLTRQMLSHEIVKLGEKDLCIFRALGKSKEGVAMMI